MDLDKLSPTLRKMAELLADGLPHTRQELHAFCGPSSISVVRKHMVMLRAALPSGQAIICETTGRITYYRQVRLLHSANDGRR